MLSQLISQPTSSVNINFSRQVHAATPAVCPILEYTIIPESILASRAIRWFLFFSPSQTMLQTMPFCMCMGDTLRHSMKSKCLGNRGRTFSILSDVAGVLLKVFLLTRCARFPASLLLHTWDESSDFLSFANWMCIKTEYNIFISLCVPLISNVAKQFSFTFGH